MIIPSSSLPFSLHWQVLVSDPEKLDAIRKRELDITKERIEKIIKAGANVVLTTQGIDDLCLKYFVEAGAMAVRRVTKEDMKRIAKATGATMALTLSNMEGEETFDPSMLGHAEEVVQERVCDDELIIIHKPKVVFMVAFSIQSGLKVTRQDKIKRDVE